MPTLRQLQAARYRAENRLRTGLVARIAAMWRGLGTWRDADVERFAPRAARLVRAGQLQEARLTLGYLDRVSRLKTGKPSPTVDVERIPGRAGGISLEDVYARPFHGLWSELADGKPLAEAIDLTEYRLRRAVEADLQLVARNTANAVVEADKRIIGYKRVLSDRPNHCNLCVLASQHKYKRGDLLPIHPACGCTVEPVYDSGDWESDLDAAVMAAYEAAAKAGHIVVLDHGEYGPYIQAA